MPSKDDKKLQIFVQHACRVSRALWPVTTRRSVATGRAAQGRRSLIVKCKWCVRFLNVLRVRRPVTLLRSPETPLPTHSSPVRVLETYDLSRTNVEHFLDSETDRDTSELLLDWSEEQAAAYWSQKEPISI